MLPGIAIFLLVLLALTFLALLLYILLTHLRARRLGLPPPSLNPFASSYTPQPRRGGLVGWISDRIREFRYKRTREAGAYEEPLNSYGAGRGGWEQDEAWDVRVGTDYEEDEEVGRAERGRGRRREESADRIRGREGRYDEERPQQNPFDDDAGRSLRGVSPRPEEGKKSPRLEAEAESPTERRSMFRENV